MSNVKEIIVAAVMPAIKSVGKLEMQDVLNGIKAHNTPEVYENTLKSLNSNFTLLKGVTDKTSNKIDDGIVALVLEAVQENAAADGITL